MTWAGGAPAEEGQWIPSGTEHAYRSGESASLCGVPLVGLWGFPGNAFIPDRNPDLLCAECVRQAMA